jgi:hypothetical protein
MATSLQNQMDTKELRARTLHAELEHSCQMVDIGVAISWLFSAVSFYATKKTGTDWFTRSGSFMGLMGAIGAFRLSSLLQRQLRIALKEGLTSVERHIELFLDPPNSYQVTAYFCYLSGVVGTMIWGYGDVISRWINTHIGP